MRNLVPQVVEPGPRFNVLAGDNGQGKTNFIESLYAVCTLRSFRTHRLAELVALGQERAKISARIDSGGLERIFELELGPGGRSARIDGKGVRPLSRYFGHWGVVLFAPEDLGVVRASPGDRRRFLDRAVWNWSSEHLGAVQGYETVLKSRNQVLRDVQSGKSTAAKVGPLLDVYDQQLAEHGAAVTTNRLDFLEVLFDRYAPAFERITQAGLATGLVYRSKQEILQAAASAGDRRSAVGHAWKWLIEQRRVVDLARGSTTVGPHRDDLEFQLSGQPAAAFASQGQTRAMVLAWKTALMALLGERLGESPILLLDDVSSELDPTRNAYLFGFLAQLKAQCFITTTHPDFVHLDHERTDFTVRRGVIERQT